MEQHYCGKKENIGLLFISPCLESSTAVKSGMVMSLIPNDGILTFYNGASLYFTMVMDFSQGAIYN